MLPCPCCGSEPKFELDRAPKVRIIDGGNRYADRGRIVCQVCGLQTAWIDRNCEPNKSFFESVVELRENLLEVWNRRIGDSYSDRF